MTRQPKTPTDRKPGGQPGHKRHTRELFPPDKLPQGVPTGAFGATVVAAITLLLGVHGLSRRDVSDLMRDMFGLPISVGGVVGCQNIGAAALAPAATVHECLRPSSRTPAMQPRWSSRCGRRSGGTRASG